MKEVERRASIWTRTWDALNFEFAQGISESRGFRVMRKASRIDWPDPVSI
ncbi:hypothetical protein X737_28545 [Mesorhizobium sp. L48C026A00]|nr:hypothetical protein X737_28545 [Mesorhizobium sp. L48C026A00]